MQGTPYLSVGCTGIHGLHTHVLFDRRGVGKLAILRLRRNDFVHEWVKPARKIFLHDDPMTVPLNTLLAAYEELTHAHRAH